MLTPDRFLPSDEEITRTIIWKQEMGEHAPSDKGPTFRPSSCLDDALVLVEYCAKQYGIYVSVGYEQNEQDNTAELHVHMYGSHKSEAAGFLDHEWYGEVYPDKSLDASPESPAYLVCLALMHAFRTRREV